MGSMQREKGARGEREVVKLLNEFGFFARRGQVFNGEPDIICPELPVHLEVKHHETLAIPEWFRQSLKDCGNLFPSVVYRQNRKPWMITMRTRDFLELTSDLNLFLSEGNMITMKFEDFLETVKATEI